jgi:hypothetical protein
MDYFNDVFETLNPLFPHDTFAHDTLAHWHTGTLAQINEFMASIEGDDIFLHRDD